jgi:spore maturation protein CgeD
VKISCLLTSFNRPNLIRQALRSIADQSHKDFELLVLDDSTILDVRNLVDRYSFPSVRVFQFKVTAEERRRTNRLGVNLNYGLQRASGDLVVYLCDDDFFCPDWFAAADTFFTEQKNVISAYGSLFYTNSSDMDFTHPVGPVRFPGTPVSFPKGQLDHGQVAHRRWTPARWPEDIASVSESDGIFFERLARFGPIQPILGASAAVKRLHKKNLQNAIAELREGKLDNLRE